MIQGHGGNVFALAQELGCRVEEILDMSSNINPLGTMPGLIDHLRDKMESIRRLPEVDAQAACRALAGLLDLEPTRVLAGSGTTQFIYSACTALKARRVLIIGPTYSDYADGCRLHGIEPDFFLTTSEEEFRVDPARLDAVIAAGYDTVFCCNSNNPTGQLIEREQLYAVCAAHPRTRFLIDESYLPFAPAALGRSMRDCGLANVLVLWSVSKIFGMPGLRAGFLVADEPELGRFRPFMEPWSLNSLAQEAICFLGSHRTEVEAFIDRTRSYLAEEGARFCSRLSEAGLHLYPSHTSYFLIRLPPGCPAERVWAQLADERILIRNCSNFHGLDNQHIRIALKDPQSNLQVSRRLLAAVAAVAGG